MQIVYRDTSGRDRSRLAAAVIELHRWLPGRFAEAVSWRAVTFMRRFTGNAFKWGHSVRLEGDGPLRLRGELRVGDNTLIVVDGDRRDASFGSSVFIDRGCTLLCFGKVEIADYNYIGAGTYIDARGGLTIGTRTQIGPGTKILAFNHAMDNTQPDTMEGITIGSNVWIGANAVILDGSVIGDGAVIAAGAVVRRHVAPSTLVGGVPAKLIRRIAPRESGVTTDRIHDAALQITVA